MTTSEYSLASLHRLPKRARAMLRDMGVTDAADLAGRKFSDLTGHPGCGASTIAAILLFCATNNIPLVPDVVLPTPVWKWYEKALPYAPVIPSNMLTHPSESTDVLEAAELLTTVHKGVRAPEKPVVVNMMQVQCSICRNMTTMRTAHRHQGDWIGDECCWDERLRSSE